MICDGFEAIVATGGATHAVAESAEGDVEIITDDEDIFWGDFVVIREGADGGAAIIVEILGFDKQNIVCTAINSPKLRFWCPSKVMKLKKVIGTQKAKIVACKVVLRARVP